MIRDSNANSSQSYLLLYLVGTVPHVEELTSDKASGFKSFLYTSGTRGRESSECPQRREERDAHRAASLLSLLALTKGSREEQDDVKICSFLGPKGGSGQSCCAGYQR